MHLLMGNLKKFTKLSDIDMQISFSLFSLCGFRFGSFLQPHSIPIPMPVYLCIIWTLKSLYSPKGAVPIWHEICNAKWKEAVAK